MSTASASLSGCVTRATIPALDLERARHFYAEVLGLRAVLETPGGVVFESGGDAGAAGPGWAPASTFLVFPTPNPARGNHTQMGFLVKEIETRVAELTARGVVFEAYDLPGMKTENGVASILNGRGKAAWFKDSEANIIGLVEFAE